MTVTCGGQCCAVFTVQKNVWEPKRRKRIEDGAFIADMLVAITAEEAADRVRRFGSTYEPKVDGRVWFKCRHWDEETRLCGVYEGRPYMCRDYPYEGECDHSCGYALDLPQLLIRNERIRGPLCCNTLPG